MNTVNTQDKTSAKLKYKASSRTHPLIKHHKPPLKSKSLILATFSPIFLILSKSFSKKLPHINLAQIAVFQREITVSQHEITLSQHETTVFQHETTLSQREITLSQHETTLSQRAIALTQRAIAITRRAIRFIRHSAILKKGGIYVKTLTLARIFGHKVQFLQ